MAHVARMGENRNGYEVLVRKPKGFFFLQKPSRCVETNLYNVLYTVSTQQYIITMIKYIQSGHITAKLILIDGTCLTSYELERSHPVV